MYLYALLFLIVALRRRVVVVDVRLLGFQVKVETGSGDTSNVLVPFVSEKNNVPPRTAGNSFVIGETIRKKLIDKNSSTFKYAGKIRQFFRSCGMLRNKISIKLTALPRRPKIRNKRASEFSFIVKSSVSIWSLSSLDHI